MRIHLQNIESLDEAEWLALALLDRGLDVVVEHTAEKGWVVDARREQYIDPEKERMATRTGLYQ